MIEIGTVLAQPLASGAVMPVTNGQAGDFAHTLAEFLESAAPAAPSLPLPAVAADDRQALAVNGNPLPSDDDSADIATAEQCFVWPTSFAPAPPPIDGGPTAVSAQEVLPSVSTTLPPAPILAAPALGRAIPPALPTDTAAKTDPAQPINHAQGDVALPNENVAQRGIDLAATPSLPVAGAASPVAATIAVRLPVSPFAAVNLPTAPPVTRQPAVPPLTPRVRVVPLPIGVVQISAKSPSTLPIPAALSAAVPASTEFQAAVPSIAGTADTLPDDGSAEPASSVGAPGSAPTPSVRASSLATAAHLAVADAPQFRAPTIRVAPLPIGVVQISASPPSTPPIPAALSTAVQASAASQVAVPSIAGTADTLPDDRSVGPASSVAAPGNAPTPSVHASSLATAAHLAIADAPQFRAPTIRVAAAPTLQAAPDAVVQPAGRAFAAAIATALRPLADERRTTVEDSAATISITGAPVERAIVQPAGDVRPSALNLRQDQGLQGVIDRIEILRDTATDGANARDTRIRLVPDALGSVDIAVRKDGDVVHVHFTAENRTSAVLLADAQPRLADLAEARGVKLGQASVSTGDGQASAQQHQHRAIPLPLTPAQVPTTSAADNRQPDHQIA